MRVRIDAAAPGAENMRRDEALLRRGEPAARLYGWRPAAVSLGRHQDAASVDEREATRLGLDVVRRPTGGGALLHEESEVTYAVVLPLDFPGLPRDLRASYEFLARPLAEALRGWGLAAGFRRGDGGRDALCYLREEGVHVVVRGRKVSGGAQLRTSRAVLQHGTLLVTRDAPRMARLLRADASRVEARTTSLEREGVRLPRERLMQDLAAQFARAFTLEATAAAR